MLKRFTAIRILITGSRGWDKPKLIEEALRPYADYDKRFDIELIHGGARGADQMAGAVARKFGWKEIVVKPNWDLHGRAAGIIRNEVMLDMLPDVVYAFWDGKSRGTKHCINEATKRSIYVEVIK